MQTHSQTASRHAYIIISTLPPPTLIGKYSTVHKRTMNLHYLIISWYSYHCLRVSVYLQLQHNHTGNEKHLTIYAKRDHTQQKFVMAVVH